MSGAQVTPLPNLIRTDSGYRVFDPRLLAGGHTLASDGSVTHRLDAVLGMIAFVLFVAPVIAFPMVFANGGFWSVVLWIVLGGGTGIVLVGVEMAVGPGDVIGRHRKRTIDDPEVTVTDEQDQAMRICALGARIAKSAAWRAGAFDVNRRLEHVVWGAVRQALQVETAKAENAEDKRLGVDAGTRTEARRGIAAAGRELALIEERLRTIKVAADAIEFKVDPTRRAAQPSATGTHWADPLQDADLLVAEIGAMRDYL